MNIGRQCGNLCRISGRYLHRSSCICEMMDLASASSALAFNSSSAAAAAAAVAVVMAAEDNDRTRTHRALVGGQ